MFKLCLEGSLGAGFICLCHGEENEPSSLYVCTCFSDQGDSDKRAAFLFEPVIM